VAFIMCAKYKDFIINSNWTEKRCLLFLPV
jgi:hypothetical protein